MSVHIHVTAACAQVSASCSCSLHAVFICMFVQNETFWLKCLVFCY